MAKISGSMASLLPLVVMLLMGSAGATEQTFVSHVDNTTPYQVTLLPLGNVVINGVITLDGLVGFSLGDKIVVPVSVLTNASVELIVTVDLLSGVLIQGIQIEVQAVVNGVAKVYAVVLPLSASLSVKLTATSQVGVYINDVLHGVLV